MEYPTGCLRPSPQDIDAVDRQLTKTQGSPLFSDLAPHLVGSGEGKVSAPFLSVMKFAPNAFGDDRQTTGDCTSHAIRNACDISRAVEIDIKREMEDYVRRRHIELDDDLMARIDRIARVHGCTRHEVIAAAVNGWFTSWRPTPRTPPGGNTR